MADIIDIDLHKFAPIYNSYDIIGNIKPKISKELGLSDGTSVITGGGDFIVSLLGLGLIDETTAVDMTGTSTLFVVHKNKPIIDPSIQNLRHVIDGWVPFTMLDCGGLSMKWCKDLFNSIGTKQITYEKMIEMAKNTPIGSEGLLFYPYLLGERRKENTFARGSFYGLTLNHNAAHFCRAIMEGVALALGKDVQNFKKVGVGIQKVYCIGGATRNRLLYQIKADVMQLPQIITNQPESSLRGCGILAAYGFHLIKDLGTYFKEGHTKNIILNPNPTLAEKIENMQNEFNKMYNHMLGYWA
jgi:xylulokinase